MKVEFKTSNKSGANTYLLIGTAAELAEYKKVKAGYYREDENKKPLYFTSRALADNVEYTMDKAGYLVEPATAQAVKKNVMNALAQVQGISLNNLQKYAAMQTAGLV